MVPLPFGLVPFFVSVVFLGVGKITIRQSLLSVANFALFYLVHVGVVPPPLDLSFLNLPPPPPQAKFALSSKLCLFLFSPICLSLSK